MPLPDKFRNVEVLAHYALGKLLRLTLPETEKPCFAKTLEPPVTLPEELRLNLLATFEQETALLKKPAEHSLLPAIDTERLSTGCLALFQDPLLPSLSRYLAENKPLAPGVIMDFLDQLAGVFAKLFELGIHRFQLQPSTLPVNPRNHRIRYLDTGLVNFAKYPELVQMGYLDGTPQFIPPELLKGGELCAASEVYVFAALTHFLFTATLPYANLPFASVAALCISEPLSPIVRFKDHNDTRLNTLIARASAKNATERIPSLQEFLDELRHILIPAK